MIKFGYVMASLFFHFRLHAADNNNAKGVHERGEQLPEDAVARRPSVAMAAEVWTRKKRATVALTESTALSLKVEDGQHRRASGP